MGNNTIDPKNGTKNGTKGGGIAPYTYEDARALAWFWGEDIATAKTRISRKVKWGNQKILDHLLYKATGQYNWVVKSPYSYQDAEALAEYWSCDVVQAKVVGGHKLAGWVVLTAALSEAPRPVDVTTYVVVKGDTLSGIAKRFSTPEHRITYQDIVAANPDVITDPDRIYPGQILRIPVGAAE